MTRPDMSDTRLAVARLNPRQPTRFDLRPDEQRRAELAAALGLVALPRLRMLGELRPASGDAWELSARLTARVVQPCVVTLAPVSTPIAEDVHRLYSPHTAPPDETETEMGDADLEPLGRFIDLAEVMAEALSLALPLYPRAAAAPESAGPIAGTAPAEGQRRPFADLARLLGDRAPAPATDADPDTDTDNDTDADPGTGRDSDARTPRAPKGRQD